MEVRDEIEKEKALFWPDFARMEKELEKQLANERLTATEKLAISDKLTALSWRWTEHGVRDISVVRAMRDNLAANIQTLKEMGQDDPNPESVISYERDQLAKLNAILEEAERKGIKSQINLEAT